LPASADPGTEAVALQSILLTAHLPQGLAALYIAVFAKPAAHEVVLLLFQKGPCHASHMTGTLFF
jgi:hypothetical protein